MRGNKTQGGGGGGGGGGTYLVVCNATQASEAGSRKQEAGSRKHDGPVGGSQWEDGREGGRGKYV